MRSKLSNDSGMTLIETLIALAVLLFGLLALAQVLVYSVVASKAYGRDMTKTAASAHDKMEELTSLSYTDTTTNVTVNAPYPANGVGLTAGGSIPPNDPVGGYSDYLDKAGARTTAGDAAYTRQWKIINDTAKVKRIIVSVTSKKSFKFGTAPTTTVVTLKTQ